MANLPLGPHRLEELIKTSIDLAKQMLEKNGAFAPFGAVIDTDGNRRTAIADVSPEVKAPQIYETLHNGMRNQFFKNEIVAGAIIAEVTIPPELKPEFPEGLRVAIESANTARLVFLPYRKIASAEQLSEPRTDPHAIGPATLQYGELIGISVRPTIFAR